MWTLLSKQHGGSRRGSKWMVLLTVAALIFALSGCGSSDENEAADPVDGEQQTPAVVIELTENDDEVIASYEDGEVTAEEFKKYLQVQIFLYPQYAQIIQQADQNSVETFLNRYVAEKTLATRSGMDEEEAKKQADELVKQFLEEYKKYLGEEQVNRTMEEQNITEQDIKDYVIRNNHVENYLRTLITEENEQEIYNEMKESGQFTLASVRHILITTEERSDEEAKKLADELAERLRNGEDFATLAKEYSEDPGSVENGGLYEDVSINNWVPEFKEAAATLEIGTISDPVKTDYGYHVMKVEERRELTLEEAMEQYGDQIDMEIMNREYERFVNEDLDALIKELNVPEIKKA